MYPQITNFFKKVVSSIDNNQQQEHESTPQSLTTSNLQLSLPPQSNSDAT